MLVPLKSTRCKHLPALFGTKSERQCAILVDANRSLGHGRGRLRNVGIAYS